MCCESHRHTHKTRYMLTTCGSAQRDHKSLIELTIIVWNHLYFWSFIIYFRCSNVTERVATSAQSFLDERRRWLSMGIDLVGDGFPTRSRQEMHVIPIRMIPTHISWGARVGWNSLGDWDEMIGNVHGWFSARFQMEKCEMGISHWEYGLEAFTPLPYRHTQTHTHCDRYITRQ